MTGRAVRVPMKKNNNLFRVNPTVADLQRGKTRQSAPDVAEHSLGQIVAYLTVCEILADASTGADGVLWCERSGFCRCGFATLGLRHGPSTDW